MKSLFPLQRLLAVEMTNLSHRPALRTYCCWVNGVIQGTLAMVSVLGVTFFSNHHPALHGPSPRELHPKSLGFSHWPTCENIGLTPIFSGNPGFSWVVHRKGPVDSRIFCCGSGVARGQGSLLDGSLFTPVQGSWEPKCEWANLSLDLVPAFPSTQLDLHGPVTLLL